MFSQELLEKANAGDIEAMKDLGIAYLKGEGVSQDRNEAMKWLEQAAQLDDVEAQYELAICYRDAVGTSVYHEKQFYWLQRAAKNGGLDAKNELAECYFKGIGVSEDQSLAFEYWKQAADEGNASALKNLGSCYYFGFGTAKDKNTAINLWKEAAGNGNEDAKKLLLMEESGEACYQHPSNPAITHCNICGKGICKDCFDLYCTGKNDLCFDCIESHMKEDNAKIMLSREEAKRRRVFIIFDSLITITKTVYMGAYNFLRYFTTKEMATGIIGFATIGMVFPLVIGCLWPIAAIYMLFEKNGQIKRANEVIEESTQMFQNMKDYFAYTQIVEANNEFDLEKLLEEGGRLFENAYARSVATKGKETAKANLHADFVKALTDNANYYKDQ